MTRQPSSVDDLRKLAEKQGWTVTPTNNNHLRWCPADKSQPVTITSQTPGPSRRAFLNTRAQLVRAGLQLEEETPVAKQPSQNRAVVDHSNAPFDAIHTGVRNGNPPTSPERQQLLREKGSEAAYDVLKELAPELELESKVEKLVQLYVKKEVTPPLTLLSAAVGTLEELVGEVADQLKQFRDSYHETIPGVRRDIKQLQERPQVSVDGIIDAVKEYISAEQLKTRSSIDKQLAAFQAELLDEVVQLIDQSERKLVAQIQSAQATVDPLTALRKRLGGQ